MASARVFRSAVVKLRSPVRVIQSQAASDFAPLSSQQWPLSCEFRSRTLVYSSFSEYSWYHEDDANDLSVESFQPQLAGQLGKANAPEWLPLVPDSAYWIQRSWIKRGASYYDRRTEWEAELRSAKGTATVLDEVKMSLNSGVKRRVGRFLWMMKESVEGSRKSGDEASKSGDEASSTSAGGGASESGAGGGQFGDTGSSEGAPQPDPASVGGILDGISRRVASLRTRVAENVRPGQALDSIKQGYEYVQKELSGSRSKRKDMKSPMPATPSASSAIVVAQKSGWEKRFEEMKQKVRQNPLYQRVRKAADPIFGKGQEMAEDIRERWETSDSPVVQRLQDWNESLFGETPQAMAMKAIQERDPLFSLPEFIGEVGEEVRPVLLAYLQGDESVLRARCRPEAVERCLAEKAALRSQGMVVENKVLHIADVELVQVKMLGSDPLIIVRFQTQQVFCVRDRSGAVVEGGPDSIMTFLYLWALQLSSPEDTPAGSYYEPKWQLREVQQIGMQTLI